MTLCNIYRTPFLSPRCSRCNGAPQFSPTWRSIRFRIYAKAERCSRWEWVSLSQSGGFWEPSCTRAVLKRERERKKERKKLERFGEETVTRSRRPSSSSQKQKQNPISWAAKIIIIIILDPKRDDPPLDKTQRSHRVLPRTHHDLQTVVDAFLRLLRRHFSRHYY